MTTDQQARSDTGGMELPRKLPGEKFTQWWARLSSRDVVALHAATTWIGIGPQSYFDSYLKEAENTDGDPNISAV